MLFKVSREAYAGGHEYTVRHHPGGQEFYRGPSIPEVVATAVGDRSLVYFDWGYDEATHSIDLVGCEEAAPTQE